nr:MAG TPA: hypothetical protein [Caudoviricetes sp.]
MSLILFCLSPVGPQLLYGFPHNKKNKATTYIVTLFIKFKKQM